MESKSVIHIDYEEYSSKIQDINKGFRITVLKKGYVLISMLFADGGIVRERSYEHNGVKIPKGALKMLKKSIVAMKMISDQFQDLRMAEVDSYVN